MKAGTQRIQIKAEIKRSNCDKGAEKRNYRVKASRSSGESKREVEHDDPSCHCVESFTL